MILLGKFTFKTLFKGFEFLEDLFWVSFNYTYEILYTIYLHKVNSYVRYDAEKYFYMSMAIM